MATTRKEVYIPLDPQKQEIRLLHLSPGSFSSALRGTLGTTTLTQPLAYEALSYAWGTEVSSNRLVLDGYELEITKNLEIALRYLRYEDEERVLWIDAVCIDQGNDAGATKEMNHQIQQMRLVYEKAMRVVAWLGEADESTELVVELFESLKSRTLLWKRCRRRCKTQQFSKWKALSELNEREYWLRVWITQEIIYTSAVVLKVGNSELDWLDMGLIGRRFGDNFGRAALIPGMLEAGLHKLAIMAAWHIVQILVQEKNHPSLAELLSMTRDSKCSVPRDRVFAVLGMSREGQDGSFVLDYDTSTAEVFSKAAQAAIASTKSLDIICAKEVRPNSSGPPLWEPSTLDLPSWVPDWSVTEGTNRLRTKPGQAYRAAGGSETVATYFSDGRIISVEGCQIGCVDMLGEIFWERSSVDRFSNGMKNTINRWFVLALKGNSPVSCSRLIPLWEEVRIKEFWKTLIGNRTTRDEKGIDEVYYGQMFDVARGALSLPESFAKSFSDQEEAFQRFVAPFRIDYRPVISNRRFFTSGHAVMGLCSPTAQVGDKIAILAGCAVPVLLRSVGQNFEFHGEAYVSGFMDGEVVELLKAGTVKLQNFSIQ